jgi:hypothetical protein
VLYCSLLSVDKPFIVINALLLGEAVDLGFKLTRTPRFAVLPPGVFACRILSRHYLKLKVPSV